MTRKLFSILGIGAVIAVGLCGVQRTYAAPTAVKDANERFTGVWHGSVVINGLQRPLILQLQERADGRLLGYVLGGAGYQRIVSGASAKKDFDLVLELRTSTATTTVELAGRLRHKDAIEATANIGGLRQDVSFTRVENELHERQFLVAILSPGGGDPIAVNDVAVVLDGSGAFLTGAFAGGNCLLWGCDGLIEAFSEMGSPSILRLGIRTADPCSAGSTATLTFDPSSQFYLGSYSLRTCGGTTTGDVVGARTTRTNTADVAQVLARLGALADDIEQPRPFGRTHPSVSPSYLDWGLNTVQLLDRFNEEKSRYSAIDATFSNISVINTVPEPARPSVLQYRFGATFDETRSGVPFTGGGGIPITYFDSQAKPGRRLLQVWANESTGWVIRGNGLPGLEWPFEYSVEADRLAIPVDGGGNHVYGYFGPFGAHFSPLTGHAYGDGKANIVGFYSSSDSDLVSLPSGPAFLGGLGGTVLLARRPVYRAPEAGDVVELDCAASPPGTYLNNQPQWIVRLQLASGEDLRLGHVGQIHPDLRSAVLTATGGSVDTNTFICPSGGAGNLLGGAVVSVAPHANLAWPQVVATAVAGSPGYYRGGGPFPDRPWAQMEFFLAAAVSSSPPGVTTGVCYYDYMQPDLQLLLQSAMNTSRTDLTSQLLQTFQGSTQKWRWGAEGRLCMAPSVEPQDYSALYTQLGGWYERDSAGVIPDEIVGFAPIAKDVPTYDAARYYSPSVDMLIARRRIGGTFTWLLPAGNVTLFYPDGEIVERTAETLLVRWRDFFTGAGNLPGPFWQRATYSLDATGLRIRWGAFAASPEAALLPAPAAGAACDGIDVVCYDHRYRTGF